MKLASFQRSGLVIGLVALLAGCHIPSKLDHPTLREDVPLAGLDTPTGREWPAQEWWKTYNDNQLDQLIALAMKNAPDLEQAQSRVRNAEQSVRLAAAQAGLNVNGSAQFQRQRISENGIVSLLPNNFSIDPWYNQTDLGLQATYTFDWWGKKRHAIESALDLAHAAQAERSAAALTIQNAVADAYFGWQSDEARLTLSNQLLDAVQQLLRIAELRVRQGVDQPDTAQQARVQLASAREMHAALEGSAAIRKVALASLIGISPADLPSLQVRPLPGVDSRLPDDVRLDLIARRPDIVASRWQVESALRQTDVARAQFFPDVSIAGLIGLSSLQVSHLLERESRTMSIAPAIHLPIFEGGQLEANYGISKARLEAAIAQYNSSVIDAARDVSSQALTAQQVAARAKEQADAVAANERLLATAQARARQGTRDARESLSAMSQLIQQRDDAASLQAQAVSTNLALIKALGGGYHAPASGDAHPSTTTAGDDAHERN